MRDDLLTITELAKLRRITSETLRYYDRIGLVKPDYVDPETRYRYYSIRQYERLGTIKELRQLDMSVEDITAYFANRSLSNSVELLTQRQEHLQQEIREKMFLSKALARKLEFLNELKNPPLTDIAFECTFPPRHMITFEELAGGPREHAYAFTRLERYLSGVAPILASDRVGVYGDERLLQKTAHGEYVPSVPMLFVEDADIQSEYKREIPAGRYICMYYHGTGLEQYNDAFAFVTSYLKVHHLAVSGKIFQIYKIDVTVTSIPEETLMEIQVPVCSAETP